MVPKGSVVGFFDDFYGAGSMFEAEIKKDTWIKLGRRRGKTEYDKIEIVADLHINGYNTNDVYGRWLHNSKRFKIA